MPDNSKLKISAKGSRKTGDEFIKETAYLSELVGCIEIDFNPPHDRDFENEIEYLQKLSAERGTKYTVHAEYLNGAINDFNEAVQKATMDELSRNIDSAAEIGAKIVTLHPALEPYGLKLQKRIDLEIDAYQKLADYAAKKNIKIGLENEAQTCFWFPDRACKFALLAETIEKVNRPNFGMTLDFGHASVSGEDYLSAIKIMKNKLLHIHAHDNLGRPENNLPKFNRPDPHLPPGKGNIKWKEIAEALREINYAGHFELECEVREMKEAVDYISKL